jgi:hypothetical protein
MLKPISMTTQEVKMSHQTRLKYFAIMAFALIVAGCSGKTMVESDLRIKDAPDWVNEGTAILKNRDGRYFHGIGSAPPVGDQSLQMATADNRARAEIARILSSYMEVAYNDYTATNTAAEQPLTEGEISRQIKNISRVNLSGAHIIAHWRDKRTQLIYALAELDMKQVKQTLANVSDMNANVRKFIVNSGDNIFDRATREIR